ncbi:MAG: hypothetical protein GWM98_01310, partial [Nitrospinaceae bacterium]|nr:hypothetical protein [Nitrospinaceae bacterium]NIR53383.1 hypothetical protein [Nitrospinaceae bacterium]NIS83787.1 hypothetical protein [Nitrospinaceae bacterium]NIT80586.1 hypothetical protein [Nitrospinaceae bacterium]NIU42907.1 hypothetical protein [Nitrospinaceae bacterium]
MTLLKNKDHRYILPLLPPLALMTSLAVTRIARLGLRRAVCGLTLGVGLFSYLYAGFLPGNWEIPGIGGPLLGEKMVPRPENWRVDEILDDIVAAGQPPPGQTLTVRTMTYHRYFQRGAFRDRAEIRGLPVDMKSVKRNVGEMTDFFIIRNRSLSDDSGVEALSPKKNRLLQDPALQNTFTLFRTYPLPDGTRALVYQKRVVPAKNLKGAENL